MSTIISWHVELRLEASKLEEFCALNTEMIDSSRLHRGLLVYERFWNERDGVIHLYERYLDSAAAVEHLIDFDSKFSERFSALITRIRFEVFGDPSVELRARLSFLGATFLAPLN